MSREQRSTARCEVTLHKRKLVKALFALLAHTRGFAFHLLRGRLTRTSARYELEFSGGEKAIAVILRRCNRLGARIRSFETIP